MSELQKIDLNAFALVRFKQVDELIFDLQSMFSDEKYDFSVSNDLPSLLNAHPIVRKAVYNYLFFAEINRDWIVILNDQINSDGCSSLLYNLNRIFNYEGIRIAFNELSTMLSYYKEKKLRVIQSYKENNKWIFYTHGEILDFENPQYYSHRAKKDRFNLEILDEYFMKLNLPTVKGINEAINNSTCIHAARRYFVE